jgi:hypothetical protein
MGMIAEQVAVVLPPMMEKWRKEIGYLRRITRRITGFQEA